MVYSGVIVCTSCVEEVKENYIGHISDDLLLQILEDYSYLPEHYCEIDFGEECWCDNKHIKEEV